jgi:hypothetical protein
MLRCDECRATADTFELGWVSFYMRVPDEDPTPVLLTYCARCARREGGSILGWLTSPPAQAPAPAPE